MTRPVLAIGVQVLANSGHLSRPKGGRWISEELLRSKASIHYSKTHIPVRGSHQTLGLLIPGHLKEAAEHTLLGETLVTKVNWRPIRPIEWKEMITGRERGYRLLQSRTSGD